MPSRGAPYVIRAAFRSNVTNCAQSLKCRAVYSSRVGGAGVTSRRAPPARAGGDTSADVLRIGPVGALVCRHVVGVELSLIRRARRGSELEVEVAVDPVAGAVAAHVVEAIGRGRVGHVDDGIAGVARDVSVLPDLHRAVG